MSCPSITVCFAVGDQGTILSTINGGTTWTPQTPYSNTFLTGVSCPSTTTCFAVGATLDGEGGFARSIVLVTTDGGSTWFPQSFSTAYYLAGVSCPSATTCYAVGNSNIQVPWPPYAVILGTTDAGSTWTVQTSITGTSLYSVSCPSTSTCFAVGGTSDSTTFARQGVILATTNGGSVWTPQPSGTNAYLNSVSCPSTATCFAVGGVILSTTNGGSTWTVQTSVTGTTLYSVSCPSTTDCVAIGHAYDNQDNPLGNSILATTDGGTTWTAQSADSSEQQWTVACPSTAACYLVGQNGAIVATTDGGSSWTVQSYDAGDGWLIDVSCGSALTCVAVGLGGGIMSTTDGGSTWTTQSSGLNSDRNLRGVSCVSATTCFAVGEALDSANTLLASVILVTTDGGNTWTPQNAGIKAYLFGVSCPSVTTCFAVGGNGVILATSDGGSTWTAHSFGGHDYLIGVNCPSATTCFVTGMASDSYGDTIGGIILATADGGSTWTVQSPGNSNMLKGVSCAGARACYAVGLFGAILATAGVTHTTLVGSGNPAVVGQTVTFTARVQPLPPGSSLPHGLVTFMDGGTALGTGTLNTAGVASFSTGSLAAGSHSITARYGGDGTFPPSTSRVLMQVVLQTFGVSATTGWSLIDLPLTSTSPVSASTILQGVLQSSGGTLAAIYALHANQWSAPLMLRRGSAPSGVDFALQPGVGYLLYSNATGTYQQTGMIPAAQPSWTLTAGWNLVGVSLGATAPISASTLLQGVLQSSGGNLATIYALAVNQWSSPMILQRGSAPTGTDFILQPGQGYLLYTDTAVSYTPNTRAVSASRCRRVQSCGGPLPGAGKLPPPPRLP
jgi:photosystem II stability/assembly factor-like uncharacterized protein